MRVLGPLQRAALIATGAAVLALLGACVALGDSTGSRPCSQRESVKTVFPPAKQVGFNKRSSVRFQEARAPVWPGRCVGWWTEYEHRANGVQSDYVDVGVTLYKTPSQALVALREPAFGPVRVLSNGAKVRTATDGGSVASVMRNVMISSTSSHLPVDTGGVPDFAGGPDVPASVQMKLHRSVHAAVVRLR